MYEGREKEEWREQTIVMYRKFHLNLFGRGKKKKEKKLFIQRILFSSLSIPLLQFKGRISNRMLRNSYWGGKYRKRDIKVILIFQSQMCVSRLKYFFQYISNILINSRLLQYEEGKNSSGNILTCKYQKHLIPLIKKNGSVSSIVVFAYLSN